MSKTYDAVVIGAGPGGYSTALRVAQLGGKVAVVERDQPGGVCATKGCIPTKALLKYVRHREAGAVEPKTLNAIKERAVRRSVKGVEFLLRQRGVDLIRGTGRIVGAGSVQVASKEGIAEVTAENIVIATGSSPADIPGARIDGRFVLSSDEVLDRLETPQSLVIVGGGAIGVEFASLFKRLGTDVAIVEMMPRLLPEEDEEVGATLQRAFERDGIRVFTGSRVDRAAGGAVEFTDGGGGLRRLETERVLIAVGRRPNLNPEEMGRLGVELERGFVKVNEYMQTSVRGIYAVGDVTGRSMLAHAAYFQGRAAAETIMGRRSRGIHRLVPSCIFSIPEVGSVGLANLRERGDLESVKVPFAQTAAGRMEPSPEGFIKVWHDGWKVRAVAVIGPGAPEITSMASLALHFGGDLQVLRNVMIPHPTLSEIFSEAVYAALGEAFHAWLEESTE